MKPRIEFFSIPNSSINSEEISDIKIDADGYVWVVSFKGLYRFDGRQFQKISTNYNSFGSLIRFYEGNRGEKFVIDYWGAIYFVRNDSMFQYDKNSKIREYYKSYGYSDVAFEDGNYHFSYNSTGYKIVKNEEVKDPLKENLIQFNGYGVRLREGYLPFMFTSETDKIKIARMTKFYLFDEDFNPIDSSELILEKQNNPNAIVQLDDKNYLFSTGKGVLVRFSEKHILETITYPDEIVQLFVDKEFNLWISTRNNGVHFYKEGEIDYKKRKVLLENTTSIVSVQDYQGGIWLYSQEQGLGYISHPTIQFISTKNNTRPLVETLESNAKEILYGDGNELIGLEQDKGVLLTPILKSKTQMMRLDFDKKRERLWISTRGELCYYENDSLKKVKNFSQKLSGNFCYLNSDWTNPDISLIGTNGYQYFVCRDDSISFVSKKYNQKLKGVVLLRDTFYINSGNGIYVETKDTSYYLGDQYEIARNSVSQLLLFKNKIVFSFPSDGIHYYDNRGFHPIQFNEETLPAANLIKDEKDGLWAISHYGCFNIQLKQNSGVKVNAFSALPRLVLKTGKVLNQQLYLQTRNNGIGIIDLEGLVSSKLDEPKLLITKVQTKNRTYSQQYDIEPIPHSENNIQIYFNSLNFHDLDVDYRYKLNGSSEEWIETKTGYVNFVSLSPNDYQFETQSRFGLGNWSASKVVDFVIVPPFWQRWWAILLGIFLASFIVYQLLSFRFRIKNREKLLIIDRLTAEQKALRTRMDPHFMFNVLSSLQYLILRKKNDQATTFLNRFSSLLRNILNQSDSETITLEEELFFLEEYIELEKMRLEDAFDYVVNVDANVDDSQKIPPFILQPFVENSIQHGLRARQSGGLLELNFFQKGMFLKVEIIDNGLGVKKSVENKTNTRKHKPFGIQTITERLKIYNGKVTEESVKIIDLSDLGKKGTKVVVRLKTKK